jgi:hypothetical protein
MMLLFAFLATPQPVPNAFDRYTAYMKAANSLSVDIKAKLGQSGIVGSGGLTFQRPSSLRFSMSVQGESYVYTANEAGGVEIDHKRRTYEEFGGAKGLRLTPSSLSSMLEVGLPEVLLFDSLMAVMPTSATYKALEPTKIGSESVDVVSGQYQDYQRALETTAYVDLKGRLLRYRLVRAGAGQKFDVTYDLSNYRVNETFPARLFAEPVPKAYVPYSMPKAGWPVEAGQPLRLGQWQAVEGRSSVALDPVIQGHTSLIVVADPEGESSLAILRALDAPAKKLLGQGGRYVVISASEDPALSAKLPVNGVMFDPTGSALDGLGFAGAPMVYLVDKSGKVVQAWLGYDSDAPKAFQDELVEAFGRAGVK